MNSRFRRASVVALVFLATASVSHAQGAATSADSVATRGALPGRGGIGGQVGSSYFYSEGDYSEGAQPRLSFIGHFRYVISRHWGWQVSPYFTWNGYVAHAAAPFVDLNFPSGGTSKEFYLTQIVGAAGQLQYFGGKGRQRWHLGAGPALYRVVIQNHRAVLKDPLSLELHSDAHLGASAELGVERFLKKLPNTSLEVTAAWQTAFARNNTKFPSGWNGSPMLAELRLGGNYYYDFRRGKTAPKLTPHPTVKPAKPAKAPKVAKRAKHNAKQDAKQ